ncbi:streptophobe family protein [Streptomyces sp. NPDC093598]|uniref:streptophobe family protein n=1 Tax=Streptomyces sp. NPDC093598 TaxID=3366046 RepID=UPI0038249034
MPWGDVLMSAVAAVSWALIGMAGTAALGLRLLEADRAGSLGPMTAAVVALGAGGSVTPSGDVSAFGLTGAEADTAIEITPLGVSLVGAVLLSWFFLRSLRAAGVVISPAELLARAGTVVALFVAMLGGLAWAGHDVITIDGGSLGLDDVTGGSGGVEIPGLGDIGGLLPDRLGDLVDAQAAVGFTVDTAPTLLGGLGWSAGILVIALLASRRTPLPRGWEAVHRVVRPAVSAVVTVLLVAVAAGFAAAAYAATGDDHPRRIAGAALLGAPNGVWLGVPMGLFVPWDGRATGELTRFLPDPLDDLLGAGSGRPVTLGRLAELDGRVWLLGVAVALLMLLAGVLAGVRTPVGAAEGAVRFAGRCALRLGAATALTLPSLVWLTDVSVTASLSVLGFDAFGAGIELHGHVGTALLLGAAWGAGAGAVGASLAWACGAAGRRATAPARGDALAGTGGTEGLAGAGWAGTVAGRSGPGTGAWRGGYGADAGRQAGTRGGPGPAGYDEGSGQAWPDTGTEQPGGSTGAGQAGTRGGPGPAAHHEGSGQNRPDAGTERPERDAGPGQARPDVGTVRPRGGAGVGRSGAQGRERGAWASRGEEAGPYAPGRPYRPPNPGTNPYLRVPDELREPEDARPAGEERTSDGPHAYGAGRQGGGEEQRSGGPRRRPGKEPWPDQRHPGPGHAPRPGPPPSSGEPHEPCPHRPGQPPQPGRPTPPDDEPPAPGDVYGAPTVVRPVGPPPRGPGQAPGPRNGNGPPARPDDGPPPPPPPPPPPRKPRGGR